MPLRGLTRFFGFFPGVRRCAASPGQLSVRLRGWADGLPTCFRALPWTICQIPPGDTVAPVLDTVGAAHFLSQVGLLFEVGRRCARGLACADSAGFRRADPVEQEAKSEPSHWCWIGQRDRLILPVKSVNSCSEALCRKFQEAGPIPGDISTEWQPPVGGTCLRPERMGIRGASKGRE